MSPNSKKKTKKVNKKNNKRVKKIRAIILCMIIFIILVVAVILFFMSDTFNIKKINVINNSKISTEDIIQASTLKIEDNMFKTSKKNIKENIKTIAYIEDVKITKNLNGEITIEVTERTPTYMLKYEEKYAYINNQGYILEISEIPLKLPVITGYNTLEIIAGKRLDVDDLEKLDIVIQIMETAKNKEISDLITGIDISDKKNFVLSLPSKLKTVEFGEGTNINVKILQIIEVLKQTEGQEGTIFIKNRVYFRKKV